MPFTLYLGTSMIRLGLPCLYCPRTKISCDTISPMPYGHSVYEVSLKLFASVCSAHLRSPMFSYWPKAAEIAHPIPSWLIDINWLALGWTYDPRSSS